MGEDNLFLRVQTEEAAAEWVAKWETWTLLRTLREKCCCNDAHLSPLMSLSHSSTQHLVERTCLDRKGFVDK